MKPAIDTLAPICNINKKYKIGKALFSLGPKEWLSFMKKADCVITNSFHGICFAVKFRKKIVILPKNNGMKRINDLTDRLSLQDRIAYDADSAISILKRSIDYDIVELCIDKYVEESKSYLFESLKKV